MRNPALTKTDFAYQELRQLIVSGELSPGSPINQDQASEELGISTTPLREALRRLSAEGFVILEAHRDTRVAELSAKEARNLLEVRTTLEVLAIQLACNRATRPQLFSMTKAFAGVSRRDYRLTDDALSAHRKFHHSIHAASGNTALVATLERIYDQCDRYVRFGIRALQETSGITDDYGEHTQMIELITARDEQAAGHLMRAHVQNSLLSLAMNFLSATEASQNGAMAGD